MYNGDGKGKMRKYKRRKKEKGHEDPILDLDIA